MKIKKRYPNFLSGFEETEYEVNSLQELLEIDWIKEYKNSISNWIGMFYSPSDNEGYPDYLMHLRKNEKGKIDYFVVGYIYGSGKELGLTNYEDEIKK